jgi:ferrous iron transport protein B
MRKMMVLLLVPALAGFCQDAAKPAVPQAAAFAYLLFVLIYSPCVAALIVLGREAGWRWMSFSVVYQTVLAWMVATAYYQAATCLAAPARAAVWLSVVAALAAGGIGLLHWAGKRMPQ